MSGHPSGATLWELELLHTLPETMTEIHELLNLQAKFPAVWATIKSERKSGPL